MKKDIVAYIARCLNCQQEKYEHQKPCGLLQKIDIPAWKWERITMDFVVGLPQTQRKFDAVWVIVDRLTKSAHFIPMAVSYSLERLAEICIQEIVRLHGVLVSIISDQAGERVLLWASPMKGVMRFGKKGKLSARFIGPFEILRRVGEVAYELALPPCLSAVHLVFHVSMLRKYHDDPSHLLDFSTVQLDRDLTYEEEPIAILDQQMARTRTASSADQQPEPPGAVPMRGRGRGRGRNRGQGRGRAQSRVAALAAGPQVEFDDEAPT
ncbi:uncharacterized protein [Nicotiana sylvestris]|uniref:uncharacterized protein n=1 Tax=Nicotiana sylvestris TaxID=4096 RepID=UPI00388C8928